ncbi:GIY-YIG nuclease family protein [Patescibacteria group bacterium]|nr:GIY-YIG nuclease family protein [Patescibacteria group bacterium]
MKKYYVYIATNKRNTVLYTGITNNLIRRIYEHKNKITKGFCAKYNVCKLIYCEEFKAAEEAIAAEKKIKGWKRIKKINLIREKNPGFKDLLEE